MNDEIKEIIEELKDNIPIEEYRSEETSDGLTHYEEDKDSWQYKLLDYITNLQQEIEEYQKDYERLYIEDCKLRENHNIDDINLLDENYKLQQDLDKANDIIEKDRQFYKCRMDEYVELKKENEFLKLNNPEMNIEHFRIVKENKRKIDNLRKENERLNQNNQSYQEEMARTWKIADDYKQRIDKAIEYIMSDLITEWDIKNDGYVSGSDLPVDAITPLLNILNGVDEK